MQSNNVTARPLWTHDFTIITLGSVISMFGNSISGFAMSLMVLDISGSTLLYAIYIAMFTIPQLFAPIVSGAILDRFSRKRTIYTLDFISAGLHVLLGIMLASGWFSFPFFAGYCFLLGSIQASYMVAYDSFYPLLISEGNFQKAYSIASVLETMSAVMVPVSAVLYRQVGLSPLMIVNGVCFFIAAVFETRIRAAEDYIELQKETAKKDVGRGKQVLLDIEEGFRYLAAEKGLMAIAMYFAFSSLTGGVSAVIVLPYFKHTFPDGEFIYMLVWGLGLAGRALGGMIHYRIKIPAHLRCRIALVIYVVISLCEGTYLFFPIPVMMLLCFIVGIGGITTYTIRVSSTQRYVPDEKKGRFNGAFNMINTLGALVGELAAGFLTQVMPERIVLLSSMTLCAVAALVFIGGRSREVGAIYNRTE